MAKKMLALLLIFTVVMIPSVHAFSLFGIDFSNVWDKITFWDNEEEKKVEETPKTGTSNVKASSSSSKTSTEPKPEIYITLAETKYTQSALKYTFANNEQLQGYVKGFNYDCVFVETDKGEKFTLKFNTEKGTLNSLKKGNSCEDKEIYMEESLIEDIQKDGFSGKKIKSYLERVDLPWTMYGKAVKVFTMG